VLKLKACTPEQIPLVKMIFLERRATDPAPFIRALRTSHMIAPLIPDFSDSSPAPTAINNIPFLLSPTVVLSVVCLLARLALMWD